MLKHNYEDWSKPIQELIQMMRDDYPNDFELVITPIGAEMRSTLTTRVFAPADDNISNDLSRTVDDFFEAVKKVGEKQ
jgi:hypothetical protein